MRSRAPATATVADLAMLAWTGRKRDAMSSDMSRLGANDRQVTPLKNMHELSTLAVKRHLHDLAESTTG
jgi:hypothetical protein